MNKLLSHEQLDQACHLACVATGLIDKATNNQRGLKLAELLCDKAISILSITAEVDGAQVQTDAVKITGDECLSSLGVIRSEREEDDFQHFLAYTGFAALPGLTIDKLRLAYQHGSDGWGPSPQKLTIGDITISNCDASKAFVDDGCVWMESASRGDGATMSKDEFAATVLEFYTARF